VAELVVTGPLLSIGEDFVGFGGFLELSCRVGVARMAIGVIFNGQLTIGSRDILVGRFASDSEDLVIIAFGCHRAHGGN
jgi:hypothetical protein